MTKEEKISQLNSVVLYVVKAFPDGIDYIRLFKILYFAQRMHLAKYSVPLVSVAFKAQQYGPVPFYLQQILKKLELNKKVTVDELVFSQSLEVRPSKTCQRIFLKDISFYDDDELSETNKKVLDEYIQKFRTKGAFRISAISHEDTAYQKALKRKQRKGNSTLYNIDIAKAGEANPLMLLMVSQSQMAMMHNML